MAEVALRDDAIAVGERFAVAFQRTLRVPADGATYPLPPALGRLPVTAVETLGERAPASLRERGSFLIPLHQREALWLAFDGAPWKPNAVQVGVGEVNAISAEPWDVGLRAEPQNYLVCPDQLWLDGINAGEEVVRQFVAVPLGGGATVEGQLTGAERVGGIQLRVFEPRPGRFPDRPPPRAELAPEGRPQASTRLGVGAGGTLRQKIYPDGHGLHSWDPDSAVSLSLQLVNSDQYRALTGREPPASPVSAATYSEHGLPWFELYDEAAGDVPAAERLAGVEPIEDKDDSLTLDPSQVRRIAPGGGPERRAKPGGEART